MDILEAYDLTPCAYSAAALAGCDPKTAAHWVAVRDAGPDPLARARRPRLIDDYLDKVEELVDRSAGQVRADVVHERLVAMGFAGDERTTPRAVAECKAAWRDGQSAKTRFCTRRMPSGVPWQRPSGCPRPDFAPSIDPLDRWCICRDTDVCRGRGWLAGVCAARRLDVRQS